ncbi:BTB/POZ protein [Myxozyma melibiosi]|uniref:Elongin-C n=1 Tax=Myxozyma melibiosi TaxID=54550 RepID=A0ABR1FBP0_9ASCO
MSQAETEEGGDFVLLVSSDGYKFSISRKAAMVSGTLQRMFEGAGLESQSNRVILKDINGVLLEKVCEYLCYNLKHQNNPGNIPEFEIPPEMALELLVASDFLDV